MPRNLLSLFLRRSRDDGRRRRRRSISHNRPHGAGGRRRAYLRNRDLRRFAGGWNGRHHIVGGFRGPRSHHGGTASTPPVQASVPAAQHPATSLPVIGTVVQPLGTAVSPSSPTPRVVEVDRDALAYVSALGSGVPTFTNTAVVDTIAPSRPPSPTPASPPTSPRASARRRLLTLGVPLRSSPSSSRAPHAGSWSPAALWLANDTSNGVTPGTLFPGGSSEEDARGGCSSRRW